MLLVVKDMERKIKKIGSSYGVTTPILLINGYRGLPKGWLFILQ
ncbi:hypothetical protein [Oceanobacillus jeddahense]|uniref:Uncharacterized protein n=1 Tax=Oceanobacillus jeddahense TaxID=1462527 RepID=A0ABY5JQE4_9BACI|nr:hypothetical protein [Oceanobacillus jeddahense]UUI02029.1 hypothetical protein NP439_18555 [Oceanobacillus jeddahense]